METLYFKTLATTQQPIPKTLNLATMDHNYYNSPYYTVNNNYYWEPQPPPSIYIHPESPAGILWYTPEQLAPILHEQQQFLRDELTQPLPTLTQSTNTYHLRARAEPQPKPTPLSPQQEATQLGITLE